MSIFDFKYPLCSGENCPMKNDCARFKRDINKSKEDHFNAPPLHVENGEVKCGFFEKKDNDPLVEKINQILKDAKMIDDADKN